MGKQVAARLKQNNFNIPNGGVAQLGEHLPCKQGVKSSNLSISIHWKSSVSHKTFLLKCEMTWKLRSNF